MEINENEYYKCKKCGNIYKLQKSSNVNFATVQKQKRGSIKKISKSQYIVLRTGEIKDFKNSNTKTDDNIRSMRRALEDCRDLINASVVNEENAMALTLTYENIICDTKQVGKDFTAFIRKLRRQIADCEYIYVLELQKRGSWHIHAILIFDGPAPSISSEQIGSIWNKGIINSSQVKDIKRLSLYLTAHVSKDKNGNTTIKGIPIEKYEKGMKVYRYSRGLKKPKSEYKKGSAVNEDIVNMKQIYDTQYNYTAPNGFHTTVYKSTFINKDKSKRE